MVEKVSALEIEQALLIVESCTQTTYFSLNRFAVRVLDIY